MMYTQQLEKFDIQCKLFLQQLKITIIPLLISSIILTIIVQYFNLGLTILLLYSIIIGLSIGLMYDFWKENENC